VKATKKIGSKNQKKIFAECRGGTRQRGALALGKRFPARLARGSFKKFFFVFTECPATWHSAKVSFFFVFCLARSKDDLKKNSLPSAPPPGTRQRFLFFFFVFCIAR